MRQGTVTLIETDDLFDDYRPSKFENFNIREVSNGNAIASANVSDVVIFYDEDLNVNKIIKNRWGSCDKLGADELQQTSTISLLKMFWFSRWLAANYEGHLNEVTGSWYLEQMNYFLENVFPNMLETEMNNGQFQNTIEFIKTNY